MTDLLTEPDAAGETVEAPRGQGSEQLESLDETRAYITRRMLKMAESALDVYASALTVGKKHRNLASQLGAARDVLQMLTEGKLSSAPAPKSKPLATVTDLAKMSEEIRLAKQAERRNGR